MSEQVVEYKSPLKVQTSVKCLITFSVLTALSAITATVFVAANLKISQPEDERKAALVKPIYMVAESLYATSGLHHAQLLLGE